MSDTPFRTDTYRRKLPYTGQQANVQKAILGKTFDKASQDPKYNPTLQTPEYMLQQYPWLQGLIEEMVDARLSMYNTDEDWAKDKSYGWIQGLAKRPQSDLFTPYKDARDGHIWLEPTEAGNLLASSDPEMYNAVSQQFLDDTNKWKNHLYTLRHGKQEEAGEDEAFYPTTDALADAITNSQNGIGREFERPLMMALHDRLMDVMKEDLAKPNPRYMKAMRSHFLPDFDYEKGNPTYEDLVRSQIEKNKNVFYDKEEFARPNELATLAGNMVAPAVSSVMFDQESWNKTSPKEVAGRAAVDGVMHAAGAAAPIVGAKVGANVGGRIPFLFNAGSKAGAYAGSALGGAADYLFDRAVNAGTEKATGKGTADYPMTGTDALIGAAAGILSGRPAVRHVPYGDLKLKLGGTQPDLVTRGDMLAMKNAAQKQKDLLKQGKGKVGKQGIYDYYLDDAFDKYHKNYPNEVAMRGSFDPITDDAGVPLISGAPAGKTGQVTYKNTRGQKSTVVKGKGDNAVYVTKRDKNRTPVAREKMDAELSQQYFNRPEFAGWGVDEKTDLIKAANKARERGSEYSQYFIGEPVEMRGSEIAAEKRRWKGQNKYGEQIPGNKAILRLYDDDNLAYGTRQGGKFVPETQAQADMRAEANKTAHRRYGQDVFTEQDRTQFVPFKGLGRKAQILGGTLVQNATPLSSYISGVVPYTYEAIPNKEKK